MACVLTLAVLLVADAYFCHHQQQRYQYLLLCTWDEASGASVSISGGSGRIHTVHSGSATPTAPACAAHASSIVEVNLRKFPDLIVKRRLPPEDAKPRRSKSKTLRLISRAAFIMDAGQKIRLITSFASYAHLHRNLATFHLNVQHCVSLSSLQRFSEIFRDIQRYSTAAITCTLLRHANKRRSQSIAGYPA